MNRTVKAVLLAASGTLAAAPLLLLSRPAEACGGCFSPPEVVTTVDSHRMVIALSTERTTLWDQIRYSGNPEDFVWVLPVPSGVAQVELAEPLFFEEIDQFTAPQVWAPALPPLNCPNPPESAGDSSDDSSGALDAGASSDDGGVIVHHEETVGPYETATISSDSPDALKGWLDEKGYNIPASTLPTIAHYVELDSAFIVMRLAPGKDVTAMQPVRVAYPGYMATFPLKMVSVGAAGALELSLFVVAEQRYAPVNYGNEQVYAEDLTWDFSDFTSDYNEVFAAKIEAAGGAAWITEYASPIYSLSLTPGMDLDIAVKGHIAPYITRLRTRLNVDNLGSDLELGNAVDPSDVYRDLYPLTYINPPERSCPDWNGDGRPDTFEDYENDSDWFACEIGHRSGGMLGALAAGALALVLLRRRRRS